MLNKECNRCNIDKAVTEFSKNKRTVDGYKYACKACISLDYYKNQEEEKVKRKEHYQTDKAQYLVRAKRWKANNPDKLELSNKKAYLKANYGISWEFYLNLYTAQNGVCAICKFPISLYSSYSNDPSACVDHCHRTGKVRGLLCYKCNLLLGHAKDNKEILQTAIEYLKTYDNA